MCTLHTSHTHNTHRRATSSSSITTDQWHKTAQPPAQLPEVSACHTATSAASPLQQHSTQALRSTAAACQCRQLARFSLPAVAGVLSVCLCLPVLPAFYRAQISRCCMCKEDAQQSDMHCFHSHLLYISTQSASFGLAPSDQALQQVCGCA